MSEAFLWYESEDYVAIISIIKIYESIRYHLLLAKVDDVSISLSLITHVNTILQSNFDSNIFKFENIRFYALYSTHPSTK